MDPYRQRQQDDLGAEREQDDRKTVIAANAQAHHIFQTMDVPDLIGRHTNHMAINWPLVGMVMDTGVAESKEFWMKGLLLSMRVLPVVPKPKGGNAIVILQDVTELRQKDEELRIKSVVITYSESACRRILSSV